MKKINEYFDDEAELHDDIFVQKMGLGEFYDAVEQELNNCIIKDKILVLGCGSGLEIERIKFPSIVVGIDISEKMLDVLKHKKLFKELNLTTVCASFLDLEFEENEFEWTKNNSTVKMLRKYTKKRIYHLHAYILMLHFAGCTKRKY